MSDESSGADADAAAAFGSVYSDSDDGYGYYNDFGYDGGNSGGTSGSGSGCESPSSSSDTVYPYANFYQIRVEEEEIALTALTAVSSEANAVCLTETCKETFGPQPADHFTLALQPSTGMLLFLHPSTSDWWQCDTSLAIKRWVRNDGTVAGRTSDYRSTIPTGFCGVVYTAGKLYMVGGGYENAPNSWSNNVAPQAGASTEIGNAMELDFVSGQWLDLDSSRKITGTIFGLCNDEINCPTIPDRSFCASPPSYDYGYGGGYADGSGSGSSASADRTCQPCWDYDSQWDCESYFRSDPATRDVCISLCINGNQAATGESLSPATLRYGHGMEQGPPGTLLVVFGGTSGNLDNSRPTAQTNENRELISGQFAGVLNAQNDLHVFGDNKKWKEASVEGILPAARSFFGFSLIPGSVNTYILFGGFTLKRLPELADTWKLTLESSDEAVSGTWTAITPNGASPSGRVGLGLIASNDGRIHLFGGGAFDWTKVDSGSASRLFEAVIPKEDQVCVRAFVLIFS